MIIHFCEQVKFFKLRSAATYLPYQLLPPQSTASQKYITSDAAFMIDNCMNTKDTSVTVILLRGYCTKIHTNSITDFVYCTLVLSYRL